MAQGTTTRTSRAKTFNALPRRTIPTINTVSMARSTGNQMTVAGMPFPLHIARTVKAAVATARSSSAVPTAPTGRVARGNASFVIIDPA
jgi:hypothetical protein